MASVEKRERNGRVSYVVRWRDPEGRQRKKSFAKKGDADRYKTTVAADVLRGDYLDPDAGRETFRAYGDRWLKAQNVDPSTREATALRLRLHAYPTLGKLQLRQVRPSTVQAWLRGLSATLAPRTVQVVFTSVSAVFAAAVDDELLRKNPCRAPTVKAPRQDSRNVTPWAAKAVLAMHDALPERYRILATLGAGLGLRQGEAFGLAPGDVDFLRGTVTVQRQVKLVSSRLVFALPKYRKVRTVPLPASVRDELAAHLARFQARTVTLPWGDLHGTETAVALLSTSREGGALNRSHFNPYVWKKALAAAGVEPTRENGMHALRHFYASVLLDAGESIKAVSEYLGHADAGFTLRTYTHLLPTSDARTRRAVDEVLSRAPGGTFGAHGNENSP
jgi:integrase